MLQAETVTAPLRAMTMLNELGDVTIVWEEQNDEQMEAMIQKLMDEGVTFFIIEPRFGGLVAPARRKLEDSAEAKKYRALAVPDAEVAKLIEEGKATALPTPSKPVKTVRRGKTAKEVAKNESVGVRQRRGG
jgi:hypothetical protein